MTSEKPKTRTRGRPTTAQRPLTDDVVLEAALKAFARDGFDGMSVRMLTRDLGVTHNAVPQRFGTKEQLWRAAIDWGFGGLVDALAQVSPRDIDPLELLRETIRRFVRYAAEHPELLGVMNIEGAIESDRLGYIFDNYIGPAVEPLARLTTTLADGGVIRRVSLATLHFLITSGGAGPFTLRPLATRLGTDPGERAAIDAHAAMVADLVVSGLMLAPA